MEIYGGKCGLCGKEGADTIDHVVPVAWGGADHPSNLVPAHRGCNSRKGAEQPGREQYVEPSRWLPGYGANVTGMVWLPVFPVLRSPGLITALVVAVMVAWAGGLFGVPIVQSLGVAVSGVLGVFYAVTLVVWWVMCWRTTRLAHGKVAIRGDDWLAYELDRVRREPDHTVD